MSDMFSTIKQFWKGSLAQIFSGAILFYGIWLVMDFLTKGNISGISFLVFTFLTPIGLGLLTFAWYRISRTSRSIPRPEFNLLVGLVIFMPVYFLFASHIYYNPQPIVLREAIKDLIWYYIAFPLTVIEVTTYTATLGALVLSLMSILITAYLMRYQRGQ